MENVIELINVNKKFKGFELKDFTLSIKKGFVTGLIGGNGVGKSTVIKLIMNLQEPDSGELRIFGLDYKKHEKEIKQRIGFVYDDGVFYEHLTLKEMKNMIKPAYRSWDDGLFQSYVRSFELPLDKKVGTFSKGMMMKASLAIALSHHAELIIMDEPTSGLDPIFRRVLLGMLLDVMQDGKKTILFSTHLTTDLERIADYITLIQHGRHLFTKEIYSIDEQYTIVKGNLELLDPEIEKEFISLRKTKHGFEGLSGNKGKVQSLFRDLAIYEKATLEDIMFYTKKGVGKVG